MRILIVLFAFCHCKQQPSCKTDRPSLLSHISHPEVNVVISEYTKALLTVVKVGGGIDPATKVTSSFFQELYCSNATAQS